MTISTAVSACRARGSRNEARVSTVSESSAPTCPKPTFKAHTERVLVRDARGARLCLLHGLLLYRRDWVCWWTRLVEDDKVGVPNKCGRKWLRTGDQAPAWWSSNGTNNGATFVLPTTLSFFAFLQQQQQQGIRQPATSTRHVCASERSIPRRGLPSHHSQST